MYCRFIDEGATQTALSYTWLTTLLYVFDSLPGYLRDIRNIVLRDWRSCSLETCSNMRPQLSFRSKVCGMERMVVSPERDIAIARIMS